MPDSILVVEYEPRYIERVRQALSGFGQPNFAKDGEEAMRLLESGSFRLIVLSSIIPKISTADLIRRIRALPVHQQTPILITVSGYNGRSPKADAVKLGATDILPKPYSEGEFLNKIKQLVEIAGAAPEATVVVPKISPGDVAPEPTVVVPKVTPDQLSGGDKVSSNDIFGDLVDDSAAKKPAAKPSRSSADLDKLLETTLSGLQSGPKKPSTPKPEAKKTSDDVDKLLETTLSGLEVGRPRVSAEKPAPPKPAPPAPPSPPVPEQTEQMPIPSIEELEAEKRRAEAAARPPVEPEPPAPAPEPPPSEPPPPEPEPPASAEGSISISSPVLSDQSQPEEAEDEDGIRFGEYVLLEKIATGGMAEVWKARMRGVEGFQKTVAIKKILPHMSDNEEFLTMFVDEAKLAAQLSHNNIIHIYELGKQDDSYFIAMEYIDGEDLKSILKRGSETMQPVSTELALFIASKIASALDYAHRRKDFDERALGLVHRDVSPQNVLISYEGDIKLCDFGIAKAASKASHTMAGALKGKLQYMSPEQAWGRTIDKRSDIFALAAVLFELLTGQKLFVGDSELSVLEQVREARVKAPSSVNDEVPAEVDQIVLKALAKEPGDRYQTAGDMARDLEQILYTFRPAPTSADLAIHMHRLFVEAPPVVPSMPIPDEMPASVVEPVSTEPVALVPEQAEPEPVAPAPEPEPPTPEPEPVPEPVPVMETTEPEEEKKFPIVPVSIAAVVLIAAIGVGAFLMKGGQAEPTTQTAQTSAAPVAAPAPPPTDTVDPMLTDTTTTDLVDPEAPATDTALDQALIDQEVQKRIEAERARLDAQRQAELKRASDEAAKSQQTPPPAPPEKPAAQESKPAPVETPPPATTTQAPPETTPPPPAATPAPPPKAPEPPAAKVVKEGDLVPVGTPGLEAPSLVNFSKPVYPPVAKMQRVEGIVIVQVLVSEKGDVLEAKVLRGVSQDVGINEAAIDAMKKSTFKPATLNGVKVRSYYTRTIPFRL
jgi:TonB family protein